MRKELTSILVGVLVLSLAGEAVAAVPLRVPRVRPTLPEVRLPQVTGQQLEEAAASSARYGPEAEPVAAQLDSVLDDAVDGVDVRAQEISRTQEAHAAVRDCVSSGLESTATEFGEALAEYANTGTHDFPGVAPSLAAASYGCIESQTGAPADIVQPATEYVAASIHDEFVQVQQTTSSGPAQQQWLELTAANLAGAGEATEEDTFEPEPVPVSETPSTSTDTGSDDSGAIVAVIAGLLALGALGWALSRRRGSP